MPNRFLALSLSCTLFFFSCVAHASSCNPNESDAGEIDIAFKQESKCAKQAIKQAEALVKAASQSEAMGEAARMCSNLHAALMQLAQYKVGEWRAEYSGISENVDEDFDALLPTFMRTQCKQKITLFRHLATQGNAWGMYQLGQAYAKGDGVTQDDATAQDWYKQSALHEYTAAYLALGSLNIDGIAFPPNYAEAFDWYLKAAQQGDAMAQFLVGKLYYQGKGVARNVDEAEAWLIKSAAQDHAGAKAQLAAMADAGEIKKPFFGW